MTRHVDDARLAPPRPPLETPPRQPPVAPESGIGN
jgi:hypothetical protein